MQDLSPWLPAHPFLLWNLFIIDTPNEITYSFGYYQHFSSTKKPALDVYELLCPFIVKSDIDAARYTRGHVITI